MTKKIKIGSTDICTYEDGVKVTLSIYDPEKPMDKRLGYAELFLKPGYEHLTVEFEKAIKKLEKV